MKKTNMLMLSAAAAVLSLAAFNNTPGWKLDADGKPEMKDGNPVFIDSSGREMTVDQSTITRLNGEARSHREAKEAAEAKLKNFEGLDPVKAREALEITGKLDQKKLIDAGEVDRVRNEISASFQKQLDERDGTISKLQGNYDSLQIANVFNTSKYVADNVAIPLDIFQSRFEKNFKIKEGKVIAVDDNGAEIYSTSRHGELASPEEAFAKLVESHPSKDSIIRANNGKGTGNNGQGGNRGGGRYLKRADFLALSPAEQSVKAAEAGKGELVITD